VACFSKDGHSVPFIEKPNKLEQIKFLFYPSRASKSRVALHADEPKPYLPAREPAHACNTECAQLRDTQKNRPDALHLPALLPVSLLGASRRRVEYTWPVGQRYRSLLLGRIFYVLQDDTWNKNSKYRRGGRMLKRFNASVISYPKLLELGPTWKLNPNSPDWLASHLIFPGRCALPPVA